MCAESDVFVAKHEVRFAFLCGIVGPEELDALAET